MAVKKWKWLVGEKLSYEIFLVKAPSAQEKKNLQSVKTGVDFPHSQA